MQSERFIRRIACPLADERGSSAVEYALAAAMIAIVIVLAVGRSGLSVQAPDESVSGCVVGAGDSGRCNGS